MITFKAYISETYKNPGFNPEHEHYREKYRDQIHHLLKTTYEKVGGYGGHKSGSKEEHDAIHDDITHSAMKINTEHGKVKAVHLYKLKHGRKLIGGATDRSQSGLQRYIHTAHADFHTHKKERRAWIEAPFHPDPDHPANNKGVTGALKRVAPNIKPISRRHMAKLTGKKIKPIEGNKHGYTRQIGDKEVNKIGLGYPKMAE